jgi:predicted Zn-dependent protease
MGLPSSGKWLLRALLAVLFSTVTCRAQFPTLGTSHRSISGRVLFAGNNHPAEGVKVEVRLVTGRRVTTTFTDRSGKFAAGELAPGTYVINLEELGCEPIQQQVRVDFNSKPLLLHLDRTNSTLSAELVSARELSIPSKARHAFQNGVQRLARNDFAGSLPQFQRAIAEFPGYYEAYHLIGVADLELVRSEDAEQAFQKSIELSAGGYAQSELALGALLCDQQRFAEAEQFLRKGLELDDTSWIGRYALARALFALSRLDEAERAADDAVLRKANLPEVYLLLGDIHIRQKNYSAVVENLNDYLGLDSDSEMSVKVRAIQQDARRALSQEQEEDSKRTLMQTAAVGH